MDRSKWEYKKLGEVATFQNGFAFKSDLFKKEGLPIVRISNIQNEEIQKDDIVYFDKCDYSINLDNYRIFPDDILIAMSGGTTGKIGINKTNTTFYQNQRVGVIRENGKYLDHRFLFYFLHTKSEESLKIALGAAQPNLSTAQIKGFILPIPPIADQQRIVAELDCLNEMIAVKQEQLKEFDKLAQSIFYDMFGKLDAPQHTLKDVLSKMGSGATPSGGNQSYKTEGTSLIRSLNVHNNEFVYTDLAFIDDEQARKLDNVIIEENDVLLNITGASVARCCIVPSNVLPARVNQHVSILRTKSNLINNTYLCHLLISKEEQTKLIALSKSKAATREALPKNILEKYLIPLPPLSLQQEFADKISAIEAQKELVKQNIAETQHLLDYTMDKYFG